MTHGLPGPPGIIDHFPKQTNLNLYSFSKVRPPGGGDGVQ